jgi:hypothetical protein
MARLRRFVPSSSKLKHTLADLRPMILNMEALPLVCLNKAPNGIDNIEKVFRWKTI